MRAYGVVAFLLIHSFLSLPQSTMSVKSIGGERDKQALLAFKKNLDHDSPALSSWNESSSYCMWEGVTCCSQHSQQVCALNLSFSGLVGSISPYIGNLSFLRNLELSANKLYGAIPTTIGHLSRLQMLGLGNNSLSGTFPASIRNCSNIKGLSLAYNQFYGTLPSWIGYFKRLEKLYLGVNNFTGNIPLSITNLSSLQHMDLLNNYLGGSIPSGLGQISELQFINLSENNFSGIIPKAIFNLTNLSILSLTSNKLHGQLPKDIGTHLFNIQLFVLGDNQLTGEIPSSLSNASSIKQIDLGGNKLSGTIPAELGKHCPLFFSVQMNELEAKGNKDWKFFELFANCSNLKVLALNGNKLRGFIPNTTANLSTQLQHLNLGENYLFGQIPSGIENLVGLRALSFSNNFLTGIIPVGIGKLQNLNRLYLGGNNFSGPIPFSIGNLTMLNLFFAEEAHLISSIPSSIVNLTQLSILALPNNALTGMLPKGMFKISTLSRLDLSYNLLIGTIPEEISNLKNLGQLVLSRNNLSGELPEGLEKCQILTKLALDGNSFKGTIPSFLGMLKGLQYLNLSRNDFSGAIPQDLGLINDLSELYLAKNNLSGNIPLALEKLTHLSVLDISYNNIIGPVPTNGVFGNASALIIVGNNRLCGGIPELHLPKCTILQDKKHSQSLLKFVIPIVSIIFLLGLIVLVLRWKKIIIRKSTENCVLEDMYPKVSYGELVKATDNFASSKLVGAGKYGRVYMGTLQFKEEGSSHQETHTVAVKVFDLQQLGSSKSFLAECAAFRVVRHRNLIQIRTCCSSIDYKGNDFKALVFDYISNGNLHRWLHPEINEHESLSPLSLTQRLNIAIDIADALDYLHHNCQPSVIHCDLKPSNVLLRDDMSACVGDFGLAKLLQDPIGKSLVESESSIGIRGSIGYVPPEYGEGGLVSTAGDVYSFGVLLLEMFTGRSPTEYMFKDGLTLHTFVAMAFPERVMDIVDPNLIDLDAKKTMQSVKCSTVYYPFSKLPSLARSSRQLKERQSKLPQLNCTKSGLCISVTEISWR